VAPVDVPLLKLTGNHATGQAQLPVAGAWKFTFTMRTSDVDQVSVSRKIRIR
jgi:copper transport protein